MAIQTELVPYISPGIEVGAPADLGTHRPELDLKHGYGEILNRFGAVALRPLLVDVIEADKEVGTYTWQYDTATFEVKTAGGFTLEDYESVTPPEDMEQLRGYAEVMQGKEFMFVNVTNTPEEVAIRRRPAAHLMRLMGIQVRWFAFGSTKSDEPLDVAVAQFKYGPKPVVETDDGLPKEVVAYYGRMIGKSATVLAEPLQTADIVVIDE